MGSASDLPLFPPSATTSGPPLCYPKVTFVYCVHAVLCRRLAAKDGDIPAWSPNTCCHGRQSPLIHYAADGLLPCSMSAVVCSFLKSTAVEMSAENLCGCLAPSCTAVAFAQHCNLCCSSSCVSEAGLTGPRLRQQPFQLHHSTTTRILYQGVAGSRCAPGMVRFFTLHPLQPVCASLL